MAFVLLLVGVFAVVLLGPRAGDEGAPGVTDAGGASSPACATAAQEMPVTRTPITGYFVLASSDACVMRAKFQRMHDVGADTAVTFGYTMRAVATDAEGFVLDAKGGRDQAFAGCMVDAATSCVAAAERAIGADADPSKVRRVLVFDSPERMGAGMLVCTGGDRPRDRDVAWSSRRYQVVSLPVGADRGCEADDGRFDLVLMANGAGGASAKGGEAAVDPVETVVREAGALGIGVYLGMPVAPRSSAYPSVPERTMNDTAAAFSARLFDDWRARFGDDPGFAGGYQSFEAPFAASAAWDASYAWYTAQHAAFAQRLPGKPLLVSPYLDARTGRGFTLDQVAQAAQRLAGTVPAGTPLRIAPQDGRGTGKVPAVFPSEMGQPVDPQLVPTVGEGTYAQKYVATTGDYVRAAWRGLQELARSRPEVSLWNNVELMSHRDPAHPDDGHVPCDPGSDTEAATWPRVAKQVSVAGVFTSKTIAYMWDRFMTCAQPAGAGPGETPLVEQMRQQADLPIVLDVVRATHRGRSGVVVSGYGLADARLSLRIRQPGLDGSWGAPTVFAAASGQVERLDPHALGDVLLHASAPPGLQSVFVPFVPSDAQHGQQRVSLDSDVDGRGSPAGDYLGDIRG